MPLLGRSHGFRWIAYSSLELQPLIPSFFKRVATQFSVCSVLNSMLYDSWRQPYFLFDSEELSGSNSCRSFTETLLTRCWIWNHFLLEQWWWTIRSNGSIGLQLVADQHYSQFSRFDCIYPGTVFIKRKPTECHLSKTCIRTNPLCYKASNNFQPPSRHTARHVHET